MVVDNNIIERQIQNTGIIEANEGVVELTIPDLDERIQMQSIDNSGEIIASYGSINIDAGNSAMINNTGHISVTSDEGGEIYLNARTIDNSGKIEAKGTNGKGGYVEVNVQKGYVAPEKGKITVSGATEGGEVYVGGSENSNFYNSGTIKAKGKDSLSKGGKVAVETNKIHVAGGKFEVSSVGDAGSIKLGDREKTVETFINPHSSIIADSQEGLGGDIVFDSSDYTKMTGTVSAEGKVGGKVEVSSKDSAYINADIKVSGENGNNGELLIDPKNITISTSGFSSAGYYNIPFTDPNPAANNNFGRAISALSTGNILVSSPGDDSGASDAGAIYLFNGETGSLISTMRSNIASTSLGNSAADIIKLTSNGNFVVRNTGWNTSRGIVAWGDGTNGTNAIIDATNSLSGSSASDQVGGAIALLTNGNYVVGSPNANGGRGYATFVYGNNGHIADTGSISGNPSNTNSVYGSAANDGVGSSIIALTNDNYVLASPNLDDGASNTGAVSLVNGDDGIPLGETTVAMAQSNANSIHGTNASDRVGFSIVPLTNGNYIISSQHWGNGGTSRGAVTLMNGTTGIPVGGTLRNEAVSTTNSLYGTTDYDIVGGGGIYEIPVNYNYVVSSPNWNGFIGGGGAVTWVNGANGNVAVDNTPGAAVATTNSLYGTSVNDYVGSQVVTLNTGSAGNYAVGAHNWNGPGTDRGAVTWVNGLNGNVAVDNTPGAAVSTTNSLYGSINSSEVGRIVTALPNGNYIVRSQNWDGVTTNGGAVTWVDGSNGNIAVDNNPSAAVSTTNSLYSSGSSNFVGSNVQVLSNGHYVVIVTGYDQGAALNAGMVTFVNGNNGNVGSTGSPASDIAGTGLQGNNGAEEVGSGGVVELANGNYVVLSPKWHNGGGGEYGAATLVNGSNGNVVFDGTASAVVSTSNFIYGGQNVDRVGSTGVLSLGNNHYVVASGEWENGGTTNAGAITWVNGVNGQIANTGSVGALLSSTNSFVTNTANSNLTMPVLDSVNSNYIVSFYSAGTGGQVFALPITGEVISTPNDFTFSSLASRDVSIAPSFITTSLNAGTNVTLQANNDITVSNAITAAAGGSGGDLTLQAGRSILINANITTDNGDFNAYANSTVADGVVNAQRDAGNAVITMAGGTTVDTGTGSANFTIKNGSGLTNNTSGDITLETVNADHVNVINNGTSNGNIVLNNAIGLSGTTMSNFATKGSFINNHGAGVLDSSDNWLIYIPNTSNITANGLTYGSEVYGCNYFTGCTSSLTTGNALIYAIPSFDKRSFFYTEQSSDKSDSSGDGNKSSKYSLIKLIDSSAVSNYRDYSVLKYLIFIVDSIANEYNIVPPASRGEEV